MGIFNMPGNYQCCQNYSMEESQELFSQFSKETAFILSSFFVLFPEEHWRKSEDLSSNLSCGTVGKSLNVSIMPFSITK